MRLGLSGKRACVGGSSGGLGLGVATQLIDEGVDVSLAARQIEPLEAAAKLLRNRNQTAAVHTCAADLSDPELAARWVSTSAENLGGLDILIVNSGGPPQGTPSSFELGDYRSALEGTLLSAISMVTAAIPYLRKADFGRIIFLSSISVKQPIQGLVLSNTARPGLLGYARSLVDELAGTAITVNTVATGLILTDRVRSVYSTPELREEAAREIPARRIGAVEELSGPVAFLASERASFINGSVLPIDGGSCRSLY